MASSPKSPTENPSVNVASVATPIEASSTPPSSPSHLNSAIVVAKDIPEPLSVILPGEKGNAIDVENPGDLSNFPQIGNPSTRKSKRLRGIPCNYENPSDADVERAKKFKVAVGQFEEPVPVHSDSDDEDFVVKNNVVPAVSSTANPSLPAHTVNCSPHALSPDDVVDADYPIPSPKVVFPSSSPTIFEEQSSASPEISEHPPHVSPDGHEVDTSELNFSDEQRTLAEYLVALKNATPMVSPSISPSPAISPSSSEFDDSSDHDFAEKDDPEEEESEEEVPVHFTRRRAAMVNAASNTVPVAATTEAAPSSEFTGTDMGTPFSSTFVSSAASLRHNTSRRIVDERLIPMEDLNAQNLVPFFSDRGLLSTISSASSYLRSVIFEFYANLEKRIDHSDNPSFEKVFVRNKWFEFSPSLINRLFGTPSVGNVRFVSDLTLCVKEMSGGLVSSWPGKGNTLSSSKLSSLYAVLHKICCANWAPSTNANIVTEEHARVLCQIGLNLPFDFGEFVFRKIVSLAESEGDKRALLFPSLIYKVLVHQGFVPSVGNRLTPLLDPLHISVKLLKGDRFLNLPLVYPYPSTAFVAPDPAFASGSAAPATVVPSHAPSNVTASAHSVAALSFGQTAPMSLSFIKTQLVQIQSQISMLQNLEAQYKAWIDLHSGQTGGESASAPVSAAPSVPAPAPAVASSSVPENEEDIPDLDPAVQDP